MQQKITTQSIETAHGNVNRKRLRLIEGGLSDSEIRELLREPTTLEKYPSAIPLLQALVKFGPLPTPIVAKILGIKNSGTGHTGVPRNLIDAEYVSVKQELRNGKRCNFYSITQKGRMELKSASKKQSNGHR